MRLTKVFFNILNLFNLFSLLLNSNLFANLHKNLSYGYSEDL